VAEQRYQSIGASWQMEGGERVGGPNVLPRWSIFTEEFPDTTGVTGAGIVSYSKSTFAYLNAEESVAQMMIASPDLFRALQFAQKRLEEIDSNDDVAVALRLKIGEALSKAVQS
jgi:hypothetical protein